MPALRNGHDVTIEKIGQRFRGGSALPAELNEQRNAVRAQADFLEQATDFQMTLRVEDAREIHGKVFISSVADSADQDSRYLNVLRGGENVRRFHFDDTSPLANLVLRERGRNDFVGSERDLDRLGGQRNSEVPERLIARYTHGTIECPRAAGDDHVAGMKFIAKRA